MKGRIRRCSADHTYTLAAQCPVCNKQTDTAHPARYSPEDNYGEYRRMVR